ncbi:MAG: ribonuclease P protein component [Gammaproteobacteria bacterium]|nr:ribonuclease P protein component [Gammaproteobacteria bacterium]MBI5616332.1 ribonuclease P protein component [Gammaproteobacteria bacterium]
MQRGNETFPRTHRLLDSSSFDLTFRSGNRTGDSYFAVYRRPNELSHPRLGIAVSRKAVRNAAARNRIKRLIRESFRRIAQRLPEVDFVVQVRGAAQEQTNARLSSSLSRLFGTSSRRRLQD